MHVVPILHVKSGNMETPLITMLVLFLFQNHANGQILEFYVDVNGSDSWDGSSASNVDGSDVGPWRTLDHAVEEIRRLRPSPPSSDSRVCGWRFSENCSIIIQRAICKWCQQSAGVSEFLARKLSWRHLLMAPINGITFEKRNGQQPIFSLYHLATEKLDLGIQTIELFLTNSLNERSPSSCCQGCTSCSRLSTWTRETPSLRSRYIWRPNSRGVFIFHIWALIGFVTRISKICCYVFHSLVPLRGGDCRHLRRGSAQRGVGGGGGRDHDNDVRGIVWRGVCWKPGRAAIQLTFSHLKNGVTLNFYWNR